MKKLLATLCILSFVSATAVSAATANNTTYTERFVQKHTQKVVNKEKELTRKANAAKAKQKAQQEAAKKRQAEQQAAIQKKQAEQRAKVQKKKNAINELKKW